MSPPADRLSLFSLNLHGHHPMGEAPRWREDRSGRVRPAGSYPSGVPLHCFTAEELDRGARRRLDRLADDLARLAPDLICLQEVAAGCPWTPRDCDIFLRDYADDWFEANSALRLLRRLNARLGASAYQATLACRGNVGWITSPATYAQERVVAYDGATPRVLFDFDANPYPEGILVEGTAVLARAPWRVAEHHEWQLTSNRQGDRFFVQTVKVRRGEADDAAAPWVLLANVHLGHKLAHFEQAAALRQALVEEVSRSPAPASCRGVIVAGDYNARLYRPGDGVGDVSTVVWEVTEAGRFDFRPEAGAYGDLLAALWALNDNQGYKPWATVRDPAEARRRIRDAAEGWFALLQQDPAAFGPWREALETARAAGRCPATEGLPWAADVPERIDFLFGEPRMAVERAGVVYPENDWASLRGTSDHPAIYAEYRLE
jgi:endonuclease/exonuclease/phosphatase family metal-dependent hydrolase